MSPEEVGKNMQPPYGVLTQKDEAMRDDITWQRWCLCPDNWGGMECAGTVFLLGNVCNYAVCLNDAACTNQNPMYYAMDNSTCDNTVYAYKSKYYSCAVTSWQLCICMN